MNVKRTHTLAFISLSALFLAFQNCSPVNFHSSVSEGGLVKSIHADQGDSIAPPVNNDDGSNIGDNTTPPASNGQEANNGNNGNGNNGGSDNSVDPTDENPISDQIDRYRSHCSHLTQDEIKYASLPVTNEASAPFSVKGGNSNFDREFISRASVQAGVHTVNARSIESIDQIAGTTYFNAEIIGLAGVIGGRMTLVANKVEGLGALGGKLCMSVDEIGILGSVGGYLVAQGRTANASLPEIKTKVGGTQSFKGYKIDRIQNVKGGTLILEDCEVGSIEDITGGTIILKNSRVSLISGAKGGRILLKDSSVVNQINNTIGFRVVR